MVKVAKKIGVHTLEVDYSQLTGIAKIKLDDEELLYKFLIRPFGRDHIETVSVGRRMFRVKFGGYMTYSVTIQEVLNHPEPEIREIYERKAELPSHETHGEKVTVKEQKDRLSKINALLDKLDERLAQGEITEARYKELSGQYRTEAANLRNTVTEKELMQEVGLKAEEKEEAYPEETPEKQAPEGRGTKYCSNCGTLIDEYSGYCPECGVKTSMPQVQVYQQEKKSAALSVLLSFIIPGAGQIYCGRGMRGFGILALSILLFLMFGSAVSGNPNSGGPAILFLLMILVWIWNVYDANKLAGKINRGDRIY